MASITADELAIWRQFTETNQRLQSLLSSRMQADSQLSGADYSVLLALSESHGKRIRSSALADHINWERSRLSHHLGRMETRGLINRDKCATDSRGAEVMLTEHGASQFRKASAAHLRAVKELFVDAVEAVDLKHVAEVSSALREHLDGL